MQHSPFNIQFFLDVEWCLRECCSLVRPAPHNCGGKSNGESPFFETPGSSRKSEVGSNGVPRRPSLPDPSARAFGRARRGATGMVGRAVLAWSSYRQGRASSARGPPLMSSGVLAFWVRQGPVKAAMAAGAAAARAFEGITEF